MPFVIKNVSFEMFCERFSAYRRTENFSSQGLLALYDYYEEECEGDVELDVIAICGEWREDSIKHFLYNYPGASDCFDRSGKITNLEKLREDYGLFKVLPNGKLLYRPQ